MTPARASGASGDWAASRQTLRGAAGRREVRESTRYTPQTRIRKPSRAGLRPRRAHRRVSGAVRERGSGWGSDEEKLRQRPPAPLPGQRHPRGQQGRAGLSMRRAMLTGMRMARWRGNRLACRPLWLGGFDQHSTQCGRRRENLRGFHDARTIAIKDGIGQVARVKDRNCGGTWELDYLGGGLRGWRLGWLRVWARFGDAGSSGGWGFFFCLDGEALPGSRGRSRKCRRSSSRRPNSRQIQLAAQGGTSSRAHQKAGAARDSAESEACAACDSVRGDWQPRRARNQRSDRRPHQRPDRRPDQQPASAFG